MRYLQLCAWLLFTVAFLSCSIQDKKTTGNKFSRLRIVIDTSANFYLDSIRPEFACKKELLRNIEYDTLLNTEVYVFDSVKNGNVSFTFVSYLDRTYQKTISLESDTTILIRKDELNDFPATKDNFVPSMKLNTGDSLVIALYHAGCYSFFKENISIRKEKDTYHVRFNTPRLNMYGEASIHHKTEFDSSFGTRIDSFYFACNELLKLEKQLYCTSTSVIYIRLGDNVFRMPGFGCTNWPGYYNLINSIDIPWPKESNASR